jgi:hypothetical protein
MNSILDDPGPKNKPLVRWITTFYSLRERQLDQLLPVAISLNGTINIPFIPVIKSIYLECEKAIDDTLRLTAGRQHQRCDQNSARSTLAPKLQIASNCQSKWHPIK